MNSLIGDRIKILRLRNNLTREELAKKIGVSYSAISMYERNKREPNNEITIKIANFFNASIDYLMGLTSDNETIEKSTNKKQSKLEQILDLANGLTIQEANYLIKQLNKSKIQIEKEVKK